MHRIRCNPFLEKWKGIVFSLYLSPLLTTLFIVFCEKLNNNFLLNTTQCYSYAFFFHTIFSFCVKFFSHGYGKCSKLIHIFSHGSYRITFFQVVSGFFHKFATNSLFSNVMSSRSMNVMFTRIGLIHWAGFLKMNSVIT